MKLGDWLMAVAGLLTIAVPATGDDQRLPAAESAPRITVPAQDESTSVTLEFLRDPFSSAGNTQSKLSQQSDSALHKEAPAHIRDNAFLVEEAYNQEPGVVQHIFNWLTTWDRGPGVRSRDFAFTYTIELPLGSQTHQFSFTTLFLTSFEKTAGQAATQQGDVGDTLLNYRYQLLADDDFLWCAPRASLILPTGDKRFGSGTGEVGYQFNLPVSRYGEAFDFHLNLGITFVPNVSLPLDDGASPRHDLYAYNLGGSVFYKPQTNLHFFVEGLALWVDEISEVGARERMNIAFINPGVRYAVCQYDEVEWVLGVSVPVGLTRGSADIGVFAYMSIEHTFRKAATMGE
jgi:hypothetical protein